MLLGNFSLIFHKFQIITRLEALVTVASEGRRGREKRKPK